MSSNINAYKYIRTADGFFIWPESSQIWHKHMAEWVTARTRRTVISAGFAYATSDGFTCFGESESLGIQSAKEDSALLNRQINIEMN